MKYILSLALLVVFATSAHAQGTNCGTAFQPTKTWNQQPPGALCGTGLGATPAFIVYSTTVDSCTDSQTNVMYAQSVRQVTGNGLYQCWSASKATPSLDLLCNPNIT